MSVPDERLQALIEAKDTDAALASCTAHGYTEGWAICDGALVIYNVDDPPAWLPDDPDVSDEIRRLRGVIARLHWGGGQDCDCEDCAALGPEGLRAALSTQPDEVGHLDVGELIAARPRMAGER